MTRHRHFTRTFFTFFEELAANNNREWFKANKGRFQEQVQAPLLQFIADFREPLADISRHFIADPRPSGGSMFRIYRDIRFSKDKSPYKTHAAAQFRHEVGRDVHAPGFYIHLEPRMVFVGAGLWRPERAVLEQVRSAIVDHPKKWRNAVGHPDFAGRFTLGGDSLKRPPRGYDADHPLIEDLKRKDFVCTEGFSMTAACRAGFIDEVAASFAAASPLMRFLCQASELRF
jgi:uncharacterized protein (TIGR02453 family)